MKHELWTKNDGICICMFYLLRQDQLKKVGLCGVQYMRATACDIRKARCMRIELLVPVDINRSTVLHDAFIDLKCATGKSPP